MYTMQDPDKKISIAPGAMLKQWEHFKPVYIKEKYHKTYRTYEYIRMKDGSGEYSVNGQQMKRNGPYISAKTRVESMFHNSFMWFGMAMISILLLIVHTTFWITGKPLLNTAGPLLHMGITGGLIGFSAVMLYMASDIPSDVTMSGYFKKIEPIK